MSGAIKGKAPSPCSKPKSQGQHDQQAKCFESITSLDCSSQHCICMAMQERHMEAIFSVLRSTVTFDRRKAKVCGQDDTFEPTIHCVFHENLPSYMAAYLPPRPDQLRHVWMNHPAWRMQPIHIFLRRNGVAKLFLGSTGHGVRHGGQEALDGLIQELQSRQFSTLITVDGPSGPVHEVKRGALDLALATGLPLTGISFKYENFALRAPGWDAKYYPLPFSRVYTEEGEPIYVTKETYAQSKEMLRRDLVCGSAERH